MKKIIILAVVALFSLTACQKESSDEIKINLSASVDISDMERAPGDDLTGFSTKYTGLKDLDKTKFDQRIIYEVWRNQECVYTETQRFEIGSAIPPVTIALPKGEYVFVAWTDAIGKDSETSSYVFFNYLAEVGCEIASGVTGEAFSGRATVRVENSAGVNLELKRPVAKVRLMAKDFATVPNTQKAEYATIRVRSNNLLDGYNAVVNSYFNMVMINFYEYTMQIAPYDEVENGATYRNHSFFYLFARPGQKISMEVSLFYLDENRMKVATGMPIQIDDIEISPNGLTNIYTNLYGF